MNKKNLVALLFGALVLTGVVGCSNVGNENPISPEMMKQKGEEESAKRAGFKPDVNRPSN
ncbi:MAG: hypothetical protein ACO1SV_20005 [Fimbriimonas sp.]